MYRARVLVCQLCRGEPETGIVAHNLVFGTTQHGSGRLYQQAALGSSVAGHTALYKPARVQVIYRPQSGLQHRALCVGGVCILFRCGTLSPPLSLRGFETEGSLNLEGHARVARPHSACVLLRGGEKLIYLPQFGTEGASPNGGVAYTHNRRICCRTEGDRPWCGG